MKYGRGLKPSTPAKVAHRLGAEQHPRVAAALAAGIVGSGQLQPCQRLDQGQTGTCHAHSASGTCWCAFHAAGKPMAFVPSPRLIASCTYADVRTATVPQGQPLPKLQDTGAELQDDANAMAAWGVAAIQAPTSDGRFSDCENDPADNTFPEPDLSMLELGAQSPISGEYAIPVDASAPRTVAACIDAKIPVWLGTMVDTAFENLGPRDIAQPANLNDPNGGGHALYISGYRTNAAGKLEFRVENSWGSGWADGGAVWASEAWLLACWSLWPFAVAT